MTTLLNTKDVKILFKWAFNRADLNYYCDGSLKEGEEIFHLTTKSTPIVKDGTVLLSGILNKNMDLINWLDRLIEVNDNKRRDNTDNNE